MRKILLIIALLQLFITPFAFAVNDVWQTSYRLENAGKLLEAMNVLDVIQANGVDGEFKTLRRGWLFYTLGRYDESIKEYRFAMERNKQSIDARLGITLPMLAAGRWREAELSANAALTLSPNNYTGLLRKVLALEGSKQWQNMADVAQQMVATYPTEATAYVYLARANIWLNQTDEAVAAYNAVLVRYPGHLEATNYIESQQ